MAISSQPTVLAQSNDAYINVGVTGRLQTQLAVHSSESLTWLVQ